LTEPKKRLAIDERPSIENPSPYGLALRPQVDVGNGAAHVNWRRKGKKFTHQTVARKTTC
jgi:hypothetical protein